MRSTERSRSCDEGKGTAVNRMASEWTTLDRLAGEVPTTRKVAAETVAASGGPVLVVMDDDPTGTQSVSGLPVITRWERPDIVWGIETGAPAVYVMTNSRSLAPETAASVDRAVVTNALDAASETGRRLAFVSRSDSTLRGHFPLETDVICGVLSERGSAVSAVIVVPAFPEAGRVTVSGVHYAREEDGRYAPVALTEFARDDTFGYQASDLREWVDEKSGGRWAARDVRRIDLTDLRKRPERVMEILEGASGAEPIVVDCLEENDLRLLSLLLARAERAGKTFVYRVGPPFVRARIGQDLHTPLRDKEIRSGVRTDTDSVGGLVIVGSHVGVTRSQVDALQRLGGITTVPLDVPTVLSEDPCVARQHIDSVVAASIVALGSGSVVVQRSGALVSGPDGETSLAIARRVSAALVDVAQRILARRAPRFIVAKGGITSSDVASRGLGIRHAVVVGSMLPGIVSLWRPEDGPARGIPYVVFPGNVGDRDSLADVVGRLQEALV